MPGAVGTRVNLSAFESDAADAGRLVDRLSVLAYGRKLPAASRAAVVSAAEAFSQQTDPQNWVANRTRQAAYLVFAAPQYQVQR